MQSISKDQALTAAEKVAEIGSIDLTLQESAVQMGEIEGADAQILRKVDRL
jgi:hypothetical protein